MRRRLLPVLTALAAVASAGGSGVAATGPGFPSGVAAGEVRATSALLWTRAPAPGPLRVEVARSGSFAGALVRRSRARVADLTVTVPVRAHLVGELRTQTLEPPAPAGTGVWEVVTGPVATNTYGREIERFLGAPGSAAFVTALFFTPPPPRGLGLACANVDQPGYAQVVVTARTLTVTPRAAAGRRVVGASGRPCAPLVLRAR